MQDLVMELETGGKRRLYEQIYEHIRDEIRGGKLLCKERLPSTRSLAEYLQVSRSTVELAYEQLLSEGYIEAVPYKGYFVSRLEELYQFSGGKRTEPEKKSRKEEKYAIDFSPNGIDMEGFPFGIWRRITRNTLSQDRKEMFALGEAKGDMGLRTTIARYLHASRGVNCRPEQIIVGAGNDFLLLLLQMLLGNRKVAFETLTYVRASRLFATASRGVCYVPSDENGIRVDRLEETGAEAVYVMPSHQYPSGVVMPIGRRTELLNWAAQKEERYIIEDDYDSEFRYRGKPIPSLQASDRLGKVVYIGTFSKAIAPAIRVSYMVLPLSLLERYEKQYAFFSSTVSRIDQTILNEFIESGAFERHLNRMRKRYKEKHETLLAELQPFLTEDFTLSGEYAGLHVLLHSRKGKGEELLCRQAAEAGIRVYGLSEACAWEEKREALRAKSRTVLLGYGGLELSEIRDGVKTLRQAWLQTETG